MKLEMIPCPKCGNDFPKLRKDTYGYTVCVECSTVEPVVGITTVEGVGDHTYNDLIIMDQSKARAIARREAELKGRRIHLDVLDFAEDEDEDTVRSITEQVSRILEKNDTLEDDDEEDDDNDNIPTSKRGTQGIDY